MNLARILYQVNVLGPGRRIGLWLCGCSRGCKGCSNPELWEQRPEYEIEIDKVLYLIKKISDTNKVDGFTITGGEPMDQAEDVAALLKQVRIISEDILIYTGYQLSELKTRNDIWTNSIIYDAAVLVDGAYVEDQNDGSVLRGSSNQRIHILNDKFCDHYQNYLSDAHNQIQNFTTTDGIISVGIHHPTF